jgi:hypothetical protein
MSDRRDLLGARARTVLAESAPASMSESQIPGRFSRRRHPHLPGRPIDGAASLLLSGCGSDVEAERSPAESCTLWAAGWELISVYENRMIFKRPAN